MTTKSVLKYSFINALAVASYIAFMVLTLSVLSEYIPEEDSILMPISMLMLFVFSAALTGFLVLGRPLMKYIDGKKREAVLLFFSTLAFLGLFIAGVFFLILV